MSHLYVAANTATPATALIRRTIHISDTLGLSRRRYERNKTVPTCKVTEIKIAPGRRWPVASLFPPQPNQVLEAGQHFRFDIALEYLVFPEVVFFPDSHCPNQILPACAYL